MWPFKTKEENVPVRLSKRILELDERVTALEMDIDTFRNKVLRKIQGKREKETEEDDIPSNKLPKMPQGLSSMNPFG